MTERKTFSMATKRVEASRQEGSKRVGRRREVERIRAGERGWRWVVVVAVVLKPRSCDVDG